MPDPKQIYLQVLAQQIRALSGIGSELDLKTPTTNTSGISSNLTTSDTPTPASTKPISDMQRQLLGLAQDVSSSPTDMQGQSIKDPIDSFISEHYLAKPEVAGTPFIPNQPVQNNVISDAMKYLLTIKNFADGGWGPITNTALKNAYTFAVSIIDLAQDLKMPISYSDSELSKFRDNIPNDAKELNQEQKIEKAAENVVQLQSIRKMYAEVKNGFKPQDKSILEGNQAIHTYKKADPGIAPNTLNQLSQTFDRQLHVSLKDQDGRLMSFPISVNDLLSPQTLTNWQKSFAPNTPLPNILNAIKSSVQSL